jgi:hypothetical protein
MIHLPRATRPRARGPDSFTNSPIHQFTRELLPRRSPTCVRGSMCAPVGVACMCRPYNPGGGIGDLSFARSFLLLLFVKSMDRRYNGLRLPLAVPSDLEAVSPLPTIVTRRCKSNGAALPYISHVKRTWTFPA